MNIKEMRELGEKELQDELTGLLREQFSLRMQKGSGQEIKPHLFGQVRKNIARIKTILAEKKSSVAKEDSKA